MVKPADVVCDGYRVIFGSGQTLSAGVFASFASVWVASLARGRDTAEGEYVEAEVPA